MNKSFCVLPFYGAEFISSNVITPCCLLPYNVDVKQLQEDILNDKRPAACQKCWVLEDQGKTSNRQLKNAMFDYYIDKDIQIIEDECRAGNFSTKIVQLCTSNLCNSTCVTCGPNLSTAWATLENKKTFKILEKSTIDSIDYANLVTISFVGGEPLYEKINFNILKKLIDVNNTDCFISATTNGSVKLTSEQIALLKQFKNLNLCLSIDGTGKVFEYLRFPLKWSVLLDNIELYRSLKIDLSVSYTISNLNTLYHNETITWFDKMKLPYNHNVVNFPAYFSPTVLPNEVNSHLLDDCRDEIVRQDNLKNIKIQDYLPEFYELIFK
jgi:sulfatase maturation enzyme AslB (radical SAM superfamily)